MASTIKVTNINTPDGTGNIIVDRPLSGSGASLTNLPAANLTGTLPAISGASLTNLPVQVAADNSITLAKMAGGVDGNIISYDASGDPVAVVTGSSGQVLTSAGAGAPPTFAAAAGGLYASIAIIADQKAYNVHGGTFTSGAWRTRDLQTEISDADGIVTISSNRFTLQAGTYTIEYLPMVMEVGNCVSRLYNQTDATVVSVGVSLYNSPSDSTAVWNHGIGITTIASSKVFEIDSYCITTQANYGFGHKHDVSGAATQYTTVKILKHS